MSTPSSSICVITGGARGMGRAMATLFLEKMPDMIVVSLDRQYPTTNEEQPKDHQSPRWIQKQVDVSNPNALASAVQDIASLGQITCWINNAGVFETKENNNVLWDSDTTTIDKIQELLHTNLLAVMYSTQLVVPYMKQATKSTIINIASTAALSPFPGYVSCSASSQTARDSRNGPPTGAGWRLSRSLGRD